MRVYNSETGSWENMIKVNSMAILKMPGHNQDMIFLYTDIPLKLEGGESNKGEMVVVTELGKGAAWAIKTFPEVPYKYLGDS